MEVNKQIQCPSCGSTQITANKQGFSAGKAIVGDVLLGPVGLLAGNAGKNKIIITCLACGTQFKPGQGVYNPEKIQAAIEQKQKNRKTNKAVGKVAFPIFMLFSFIMFASGSTGFGVAMLLFGLLFMAMAFSKDKQNEEE